MTREQIDAVLPDLLKNLNIKGNANMLTDQGCDALCLTAAVQLGEWFPMTLGAGKDLSLRDMQSWLTLHKEFERGRLHDAGVATALTVPVTLQVDGASPREDLEVARGKDASCHSEDGCDAPGPSTDRSFRLGTWLSRCSADNQNVCNGVTMCEYHMGTLRSSFQLGDVGT